MRPNGQEVQDWRTSQEFRLKEMLLPKVATAPRKVGQVVSHCEVAAETAALAVLSMKEVVHDNDQEHMGAMNMVQVRGSASGRCVSRGTGSSVCFSNPREDSAVTFATGPELYKLCLASSSYRHPGCTLPAD